ncbi:transcription/translation regulatory transformer protein RfaH [Wenzhouxiangella sp. AB-CW3]|uniref:transcription termination/antitermination protein NusG n=1 Tax=Wenzhouxiangella sp. AB-CW3 TaxID=2771012 RepID=UPI00168B7DDC|nr:transcription termination/antitermination NusG family protein [Wenzhouxiangella sp. AB-CW3]QOC23428.1 transcription/translation regulatory transformer protein RfaH [Wenzhouxiangella sp. AB-CW3]
MSQHRQWRAVLCRPKQERKAEAHLEHQGFEVFLPRLRARRLLRGRPIARVEPLFPRYLFVRLEAFADDWSTIRSTRGAIGLVRFGNEFPVLEDGIIYELRARQDDQGLIDLSAAMDVRANDPVEITSGAMAGLRAVFRARTGEDRVIVLLKLLNKEREIELPRDHIRKVV